MAEPRVVLVTGTRKGIGLELARHFLGKGEHVIGVSRGEGTLTHERYEHHRADVTDEAAVKALFAGVRKTHGRLDALVNNACIAAMNHSLLMPVDAAQRVLDTNVLGTFLLCREAGKLMQKAHRADPTQGGRIVNFTTVAVRLDLEGEAVYAASKAAVESLTRILARELAPFGVTVNAVGPGPLATDLIRAIPKEKIDALLARQPIGRMSEIRDVLNVVDFFLDPKSDFVTGQVLYLGGV